MSSRGLRAPFAFCEQLSKQIKIVLTAQRAPVERSRHLFCGSLRVRVDAIDLRSRVDISNKPGQRRLAQIFDRLSITDESGVDLKVNLDTASTDVQQNIVGQRCIIDGCLSGIPQACREEFRRLRLTAGSVQRQFQPLGQCCRFAPELGCPFDLNQVIWYGAALSKEISSLPKNQ